MANELSEERRPRLQNHAEFIAESAKMYRDTLVHDVVPFWQKYAVDPESGAINNCIDDEGRLQSRDRYIWSQGRALWTFSALCNRIEPKSEWLSVANGLYQYLGANGRDARGRWMYRLDADGSVLDRDISIYVDGFVMNGFGEYYLATGDTTAAALASETFENIRARLKAPGSYGVAPYSLGENNKTLGVPMVFSFFFYNLGKALGRPDVCEAGYACAKEVLRDFYDPEKDALLELVTVDDASVRTRESGYCVPGHAIEACWFLLSIFEKTGEAELIERCCRLITRHIELGWDEEYGGIRLAVDLAGEDPPRDLDIKPWWVQVEALVATAYAYLHTRDKSFLDWHERIRKYAYSRYPTPAGEWTQWLDRYGRKTESVALPVKDPFHLPRGLMYLLELFEKRMVEA
ncbi:MAG: AGE family epimerase/isomerase [Armatimonadota bacterium]|nr:AGE family epimerase/isomerase [Armatimonadota bacterium]